MVPSQLIWLALGLSFVGWVLGKGASDGQSVGAAVIRSLSEMAWTVAAAAGLAAFALSTFPKFSPEALDSLDLKRLNAEMARALTWVQRAWLVPLAVATALLALVLSGRVALREVAAARAGKALQGTLKVKAIATILACTTLTLGGWRQTAKDTVARAEAMREQWPSLRLALSANATDAALDAMAQVAAQTMPTDLDWGALSAAHGRYWTSIRKTAESESPRKVKVSTSLRETIEPRLPDLPYRKLEPFGSDVPAPAPLHGRADPLMRAVFNSVFDNAIADPARDAALSVGHPLINELIGAFVNPVVAAPLRDALVAVAVRYASDLNQDAAHAEATDRWKALPQAAQRRVGRALARARSEVARREATAPAVDAGAVRAELAQRGVQEADIDNALRNIKREVTALAPAAHSVEAHEALLAAATAATAEDVLRQYRSEAMYREMSGRARAMATRLNDHRARRPVQRRGR